VINNNCYTLTVSLLVKGLFSINGLSKEAVEYFIKSYYGKTIWACFKSLLNLM